MPAPTQAKAGEWPNARASTKSFREAFARLQAKRPGIYTSEVPVRRKRK